jgi:hypothetical protein
MLHRPRAGLHMQHLLSLLTRICRCSCQGGGAGAHAWQVPTPRLADTAAREVFKIRDKKLQSHVHPRSPREGSALLRPAKRQIAALKHRMSWIPQTPTSAGQLAGSLQLKQDFTLRCKSWILCKHWLQTSGVGVAG